MTHDPRDARRGEHGFTLIEALVAVMILIFGLAAIANLLVVAGSSNTVANHATAATAVATQQMELLKGIPYNQLAPLAGGNITADVGPTGVCGVAFPTAGVYNCTTQTTITSGNPMFDVDFKGVGAMHVRWRIWPQIGGPLLTDGTPTTFIEVAAESTAPAVGRRSRVVLTTYRTLNAQ